ncbi:unnamed protein product [Caenorhabditis bovis]|uniref:Protein kinase domain-containing protein n=1 Tax=Caenorhabditis bovis TaxID=2654633 RepID=A0A8S1EP60_9PELO|nr:unnamed protein product [Caenorhabditis bovis]
MAFLNRVKNLFRGGTIEKKLPSYIQDNVNPKDHWNIIGELGDGAFGKVEKAVSKTDPHKFAASKSIEIQEGEEVEDFLIEIEILTQCKNHPNMVGLYSCYFFENKLTMMLEFCGGGAVDNIMLELEKPLTESQIRYIAYYVCEALKFIHSQNVIHRDLKAGNILLTDDGQVKLADFGVSAKLKSDREKRDTFIGTPYWMAPEVMMCETFKDQPYDCKADIWSYGITLIEMAQMEPPHSDVSPMRVLIKVQKSPPPTLDENSHWSSSFRNFLKKCLVKQPVERLSASELLEEKWLSNATSEKKSILMLLAEMQADVKEEVIIDADGESIAESEDNSARHEIRDTWSSASESPVPINGNADFIKPSMPIPPETPKKRAAPPPPVSPAHMEKEKHSPVESTVELIFKSESDRNATTEVVKNIPNDEKVDNVGYQKLSLNVSSPSKETKYIASPGREAMNILDDLNIALDGEPSEPSRENSYKGRLHSSGSSVSSTSPTKNDFQVEHSIRDIINANRHASVSPPILPSPGPQYASHESLNKSLHKTGSEASVTGKFTFNEKEAAKYNASKQSGAVNSIQAKFERVNDSPNYVPLSPPCDIPDGIVKAKKKAVEESTERNLNRVEALKNEYDGVFKRPTQDLMASRTLSEQARIRAEINLSLPLTPGKSPNSSGPTRTDSSSSAGSNRSPSSNSTPQTKSPEYFELTYSKSSATTNKTPPPEPPVDYDGNAKAPTPPEPNKPSVPVPSPVVSRKPDGSGPRALGGRRDASRQTVTKKTRTYMIDGVQVTSTTVHVLGVKDDKVQRKQQLHDLRRLQRDEARQKQELQAEGVKLVDEQARKFALEQQTLNRQSDLEMEAMERRQRKEMEEAEAAQEAELRNAQKRLKIEQEKDMKAFRERLKQDMKIFKQELTMLSKVQRKDALKQRKDQIEIEHQLKEKDFMMQLSLNGESMLQRMVEKHKERMASMEKQFLLQKHNLLRAKENNIWELEDKQMREKFVLHRKLFKDEYYLLRTQMLARHQREMSQIEKMHQEEEDELIRALTLDRKKLPKMLRAEAKTRSVMFKESLRISMANMSNAEMQERIRKFDEQEALRMRLALEEHDLKSQKKLQALKEKHQEAIIELDEMQNEKRKQLLEKEKNTMYEHEMKYHEMRNVWQENLVARKTSLEERFQEELSKQEMFYGLPYNTSQATTGLSARQMT